MDMPTCNPLKTLHNIWFQQSGKMGTCLYIVTFNDYIQALKQTTLYYHSKKGGPSSYGHDKSEFFLHKAS